MQGATCTCVGLKIAGSPCPSVTRLFVLFVCCNATCRPKWRSDAVPLGCASISTTSAFLLWSSVRYLIWTNGWFSIQSLFKKYLFFFIFITCFPASSHTAVLKCTKLSQCLCRPEQLIDFPRFLQARFHQHPWCTAVASPCFVFFLLPGTTTSPCTIVTQQTRHGVLIELAQGPAMKIRGDRAW